MANEVKNYFLSPSWDYTPDAKPGLTIALWNIVTSPTKMVPPLVAATAAPAADDTATSTKTEFEWTRERDKEKRFGVWTKFLDMLVGIGINIGHKRKTSIHDLYTFDKMVTKEAFPAPEYVDRMVKEGPAKKYLEKFDFEKPLYLVIGTKAVSGTNVKQVLKKEQSTDFKLSVDATQTAAPLSLGPELGVSDSKGDTLSFKGSSDFVFAFRIQKIVVNRQFEIQDEDGEMEGAVLGTDEETGEGFEVQGVEGSDSRVADLPGGKEEMVNDGEEQVCVTYFEETL